MSDLPVVLAASGAQPTPVATLTAELSAAATAIAPGLTTDLPGTLIEDLASTGTGALVVVDSAVVDLINSLTPLGANLFLLNQLGQLYGVQKGVASNGSVAVVFSAPTAPGFLIAKGFIVGDGTNQYIVQDGGVLDSNGNSQPLYAVSTNPGTFAIPPNTVTSLETSVPASVVLTVTNPLAGLPAAAAQTQAQYRGQVITAGLAAAQGFTAFLKTLLGALPGVQTRLIAVNIVGLQYQVVVGGGDPYLVAGAIYQAVNNPAMLTSGDVGIAEITNANPGVITTAINHGYATGQTVEFQGIEGTFGLNGNPYVATVLSPNSFSIPVDTTLRGAYSGGGVVTPNLRGTSVTIDDYPDEIVVPFAIPLQQEVALTITWNTDSPNYIDPSTVETLVQPPVMAYLNSLATGQPINTSSIDDLFKTAVEGIITPELISRLVVTASFNGTPAAQTPGTFLIQGDALSYFFAALTDITVVRG